MPLYPVALPTVADVPGRVPAPAYRAPSVGRVPEMERGGEGGRALAAAFGNVSEAASATAQVLNKLNEQMDQTDTIMAAAKASTAIEDLKTNTLRAYAGEDPSQPATRPEAILEKFNKDVDRINADALKGLSPNATRMLQNHLAQSTPAHLTEMRNATIKVAVNREQGETDTVMNALALSAGAAVSDASRAAITKGAFDVLEGAGRRGVFSSREVADKKIAFQAKSSESQMRALSFSNPDSMVEMEAGGKFDAVHIDTRMKILEGTRQRLDAAANRETKAFNEVKAQVEDQWAGLANQGLLAQSDLDIALKNEHLYITPDKARALQAVNDNPPGGDGALQVQTIRNEYHLKPMSFENVRAARAALNKLQLDLGRPNPLIDKLANELQSDELRMREVGAAEINAGIKRGHDLYDSQTRPLTVGPMMNELQRNQEKADKAKISEYIRRGMTPETAEGIVRREREVEKEQRQQGPKRNLDKLIQGR